MRKSENDRRTVLLSALAAAFIAAALTAVSYPGILYSDSYVRINMANAMLAGDAAALSNWLSVLPSVFIALSLWLCGSISLYTFAQSFLFLFTSYLVLERFCGRLWYLFATLFTLCPAFFGYSVYLEGSVGCVCALNILILLICFEKEDEPLLDVVIRCVLAFAAWTVLFGFRQNSFTVIPAVLFYIWHIARKRRSYKTAVVHTGLVGLSLALVLALPSLLGFGVRVDVSSAGFLWESVGIIKSLPDKTGYEEYFDYLGGDASTLAALEANSERNVNAIFDAFPMDAVFEPGNAAQIKRDYLSLLSSQPKAFFENKLAFASRTLGISAPLDDAEFDYNRYDAMDAYKFNDVPRRFQFVSVFHSFMESFSLARRPWLCFLLCAALLAVLTILRKRAFFADCARERLPKAWFVYALAVFYYAAFLVTTQSHEFRYFFPAFALLFLCVCCALGTLADSLLAKVLRRQGD